MTDSALHLNRWQRRGAFLALLAMMTALFGINAPANTLNGEWVPMGGVRNGCDTGLGIDDAIALPDGGLMIVGDIRQCLNTSIPAGLARYDAQSGEWSAVPGFLKSSADNRIHRVGNRVFVTSANSVNYIRAEGLPDSFILQLDLTTGVWSIPGSGVNGGIATMISDGQSLFVGGSFSQAGGSPAQRLARYDLASNTWHPLSTEGDGTIYALAFSDDWLYAGGTFTAVNGVPANRIARMRRSTGGWESLGEGVAGSSSTVRTIAVGGNMVYTGGIFDQVNGISSPRVAAWQEQGAGGQWIPIGVAGSMSSANVHTLIAHATGLYAAAQGGWVWAGQLARWTCDDDGCRWITQGGAAASLTTGAIMKALAVENDIYLFGELMYQIGDIIRANGIVRYDTTADTWHGVGNANAMGVTLPYPNEGHRIRSLKTVGDKLVAGGYFEEIGGIHSEGFAFWDGTQWTDLSGDWNGDARAYSVNVILPLDEDEVAVSGYWAAAPFSQRQNLARCRLNLVAAGSPCTSMGGGTNGDVYDMLRIDDTVIVAGSFSRVGHHSDTPIQANALARYDVIGNTWSTFATVDGGNVETLLRHGDTIYVGGNFSAIDGVQARRIARYNLTTGTWHALGTGITGSHPWTAVSQLAVINDNIYVGGLFHQAGGQDAPNIARWSPETEEWAPLGGGIVTYDGTGVISLLADGHLLYVGGRFENVNGYNATNFPAWRVAAWDTSRNQWFALPGGGVQTRETYTRVSSIERYGNAVYLGGGFTEAGNMPSRHFAGFIWAPDPLIFESSFEPQ